MFSGFYVLGFLLSYWFYLGYAASFDEVGDSDSSMWIQDSRQAFLFIFSLFAATCRGKHARDLGKYTNRVDRLDIRYDITINIFVLQEKCTKIRLTTFHHFFYSGNNVWVSDHDSLVESGEERAACDREC